MKKKVAQILRAWEDDHSVSEKDKILYAWNLAATPDQRWQRNLRFLRSHNLLKPYKKKKSG